MPAARFAPEPRLDDLIGAIRRAHVDPLSQLADAAIVAEDLGELADSLVGHFVDQARRSGASWTEIGASLGVTKQAAQKRFVSKLPGGDVGDPRGGFARFTPRARNVVVTAHDVALRRPAAPRWTSLILCSACSVNGRRSRLGSWLTKASTWRSSRPGRGSACRSRRPTTRSSVTSCPTAPAPAPCSKRRSVKRSGSNTTTWGPSTSCWRCSRRVTWIVAMLTADCDAITIADRRHPPGGHR